MYGERRDWHWDVGTAFQSASLSDSFFSKYEKRETFIKTRLGSVKRKLEKLFSHS